MLYEVITIRTVLPTLNYLLEQEAKIIICTHMGRPKGERVEKFSLAPVAAYLAKLPGKILERSVERNGSDGTHMV